MEILAYLAMPVSLILFSFMIQPSIERRWPDTNLPINLMRIAVGSAIILIGTIEAIADGRLAVSGYFIILGILVGILIYYGITHRHEVSQRMRRAYYGGLVGFTYCLSATGVLMFWFAPFFPKIVL
ncbi:MAG: hypothetical protein AB1608_07140 [Thermoproteota archaeon]